MPVPVAADECQPEGGFINYIVFPYCTVNSSVVGLAIFVSARPGYAATPPPRLLSAAAPARPARAPPLRPERLGPRRACVGLRRFHRHAASTFSQAGWVVFLFIALGASH